MVVLKCKMCGATLNVGEDYKFAECQYCGSRQTLPNLDDELKTRLFDRATELRLACDFDQAASVFQNITVQFPDEAEAYWGLVLCKYGIEYVNDPRNGQKVPTCHRTRPQSVLSDPDFLAACDHAGLIKWKYEEEARAIDSLQQKILSISRAEEPYDVFICYKETDELTHARTEDSEIAQDIYNELITKGYKVFFSRVTLRGKAGAEYEPYIYAALSSAKVMLVLGSKQEYFNAVWLKNEWSRYLDMMTDSDKVIIPCYKTITPEQLPRQLQCFQALNITGFTFLTDLLENIRRIVVKTAPTVPAPVADSNRKELNFDDGAYIGEAIGDRPHGHGTRYYKNGDKYEGDWHFGVKQGQGTFTYANGETWTGEWKDDKRFSGKGTEVFLTKDGRPTGERYDGEYQEGRYHGQGTHILSNRNRYEGDFVKGLYHGQGTYTYATGQTWIGEWKNNMFFNGNGTVFYFKDGKPTGERYDGALREGKYHGKGVKRYANGGLYEGDFANGVCSGYGVFVKQNGDRYEGELANNKFNGQGTYTYADGTSWVGEWKEDARFNGNGRVYLYSGNTLNGNYYEGSYQNGRRSGKGMVVFANGDRFEGVFANNMRQGHGTLVYANGETWTGEWKDDAPWDGNGFVKYFTDGVPNGNTYKGEMKNGKRNGQGILYWKSGDRYEGGFSDNKYHGRGTYVYASGETWTGEWKDDAPWDGNGFVKYFTDGVPNGNTYKGEMKNGKRNGQGILYWKSGDRYEGGFADNKYHGRGTYVYASGETWTGEWKDDYRWNGKGALYLYSDGKLNGNRYEGQITNGKFHGQGALRWSNGYCTKGEFRDDEIHNGQYLDPSGKVVDTFVNGASRNQKTQKRNQIIGGVLRGLAGM